MCTAGCWYSRKRRIRHDAEKAALLERMAEETLRAKYAATGAGTARWDRFPET